ncbi:MAG: mechanosensitive ion channel family protein, partial [Desulfobacterales bacterium]
MAVMEIQNLSEFVQSHMAEIKNIIISISVGLGAVFAGLGLQMVISYFLERWRRQRRFADDEELLKYSHFKGPLRVLLPAILLSIALPTMRLPENVDAGLRHILIVWIIAVVAWFAIRFTGLIKALVLRRYKIENRDNLQARRIYTQFGVIERVLNVLIIFLSFAAILLTFERVREIGVSLLASAGVVGIILGFAAQKSLATLFAGVQIALTQPIRIDDVVIVENEWGWIEEITLTYVVVKIWDQRRLVLPITYFIEKPFQNWTRTTAELLGSVYLYADYTLPVPEVREELKKILQASPQWDQRVGVLQVTNANERTIELRALMSAKDSSIAWDLRCHVREQLIEFMQHHFPASLPHVRIELEQEPEVKTYRRQPD